MEEIFRRMLERISDRFDKTKGTFFYDVLKPVAYELQKIRLKYDEVVKKLSVKNLKGEELDMYISDRTPLARRMGTKATGYVTLYGREGTVVNKGSLVSAGDLYFQTLHTVVIPPEEEIDVEVECEKVGNVGNVPEGAINEVPVSILGVEGVENKEPFENGYNTEDDESLLERYMIYKNKPITSNNIYHYELWALSIDGVGAVKIIPTWDGPNTAKIIVMDSNNQPANDELIKEIQDYIDPKEYWGQGRGVASGGAFVTVESAKLKPLNIEVDVALDSELDKEDVKNTFIERLNEYFSKISFKEGGEVKISEVGCVLMGIYGVNDYRNILLDGEDENVSITGEEIVVAGEVKFNELL